MSRRPTAARAVRAKSPAITADNFAKKCPLATTVIDDVLSQYAGRFHITAKIQYIGDQIIGGKYLPAMFYP